MSTGYELRGRTSQKQRTRNALIEAARELFAQGVVPTVEEVAAAAAISRTTAYRYFSTQGELLLAAHPELAPRSLPLSDAPTDVARRLDAAVVELTRMTREGERQLRAMLQYSLSPDAPRQRLSLRRGRAIAWIEEAIANAPLSASSRRRVAIAVRATVGIEALVWLTDVAGIERDDAAMLQRWVAQAIFTAALEKPPPAPKRRRKRRADGARAGASGAANRRGRAPSVRRSRRG